MIQQKPVSPSDPARPPSPQKALPEPARPTTIPEGVAGSVHDDPGLAPALMTGQPSAPGKPATPEERTQEFVPVEGGSESASAGTLLVVAYLIMWAVLIAFVLLSWRRQQRIDGRIAEIEATLAKREK